jgi:hypothetical protein
MTSTTTRYTSITYKQTLVNFRTSFEDDNAGDNYDISFNSNISCDVNMPEIEITEANLRAGFLANNCDDTTPANDSVMIAAIRTKLNAPLDKTVTNEADKSVKQKLLEYINNQDDLLGTNNNRIKWLDLSYAPVVLSPFASGLVGTDLAITTYDIINDDIVNFIFRFSGGPRSVDTATSSYYTVKIPFKITNATGPSTTGQTDADTDLPDTRL